MIEVRCTGTSDEKGIVLSCEGLESLTPVQETTFAKLLSENEST